MNGVVVRIESEQPCERRDAIERHKHAANIQEEALMAWAIATNPGHRV